MSIHNDATCGRREPYHKAIIGLIAGALALVATAVAQAADNSTIRFGVPTWPGVTVKSEVASQILNALGYRTTQTDTSPSFAINALKTDDLDIYLGGWMPSQENMINPLEKKGEVAVLATNVSGVVAGLAVPTYVWDAGVHTEADLANYADRFDRQIYGIEAGSGFNAAVTEAIENDEHSLGSWNLVASSTSAMLSQVGRKIDRKEWIVFDGWQPHWMNVEYDMKYLKAVDGSDIAEIHSTVLTVANPQLVEQHPEVARFFRQYVVTSDMQSEWVLEYSFRDRAAEQVAREWIRNNLDTVAEWLEGVKARDGKRAIDAMRAEYSG